MSASRVKISDRVRQGRRLLGTEGVGGVAHRLRRRGAHLLAPPGAPALPVSRADLRRAGEVAAEGYRYPPPLPLSSDQPMTVAWVDVPPSQGSGGQTTI